MAVDPEVLEELIDQFEWGGCDDNINFGYKKSKQFLVGERVDERRFPRKVITQRVTQHNYEAGRLVSSKKFIFSPIKI